MSQSYRSLKLKVATRIPAQLVAGTGVSITKAGGVYTFDLDETEIEDIAEAAANAAVTAQVGIDIQAYDADLAALAGLTSAADKLPYFTGSGTASLADFTAAGRALIDDANAAAQRTTLGLGNVDNTSDANKPVSSATQTALEAKAAGAASSTDNAAARFDNTTGKLLQNSALIIADTTGSLSRSGNGGIPVQGTNTNDSAAAGYLGEVVSASATSGSLTTANPAAVTSISLTAGDWDISASVQFNAGGATSSTDWHASISATSASVALPIAGTLVAHERTPATTDHSQFLAIPPAQVSISGTTTYYINVRGDFTGTAPTATAIIRARRAR